MGLDRGVLNDRRGDAMDYIYWSRPSQNVLSGGHSELYQYAAEYIGIDKEIDYLEFGVGHGKSISEIVKLFTNKNSRFYGFDSFVGLPEKWLMHDVGAFSNNGVFPDINDPRVSFVKGWFQNTVPNFLREFKSKVGRPVFIHFDADLYASTLFLLANIWQFVDEYYFMMDDFIHDDVIAFRDFEAAFPVEFKFFAQTAGGGVTRRNPDQVFGHMKRKTFELPTAI